MSSSASPFLESIREYMLVRHYSRRTVSTYLCWIRYFMVFHGEKTPWRFKRAGRRAILNVASRCPRGISVDVRDRAKSGRATIECIVRRGKGTGVCRLRPGEGARYAALAQQRFLADGGHQTTGLVEDAALGDAAAEVGPVAAGAI
ncbi:hypothetical protein HCU74_12205 [Spongiibacter sp. KMU-166]|uniref:Integrase SAM-like N-terminal domain-containing protein n=1 Tax=Spongiibacter thalassae TaxID=2721624 RepID=A0ABX1GG47_9GAMM|nr:hypothetical protein [Spongiibacter thalassae]